MTRARTIADYGKQTADLATQAELDASYVPQGEPHIIPGVLYPAVTGKLLDGSTSHSGAYGTAQSDTRSYYYTDIKGSKSIKDPRIGGHFGSQRHKFKSLQLLEQETATHGESVMSADGREWARLVGTNLKVVNNIDGQNVELGGGVTEFIEITGYFSDINVLILAYSTARRFQYAIDGGSTTQVTETRTTVNTPLLGRYVDSSSLYNLGLSSTTLGIHTLKIINTDGSSSQGLNFWGVEFIAQDTSSTANKSKIQIPSQNVVSYGKKFTVSGTPHYDPFNGFTNDTTLFSSVVDTATSLGLGTATTWGAPWDKGSNDHIRPFNGGRVVKWVDSSGTIKTSVTMMPRNAQNLTTTVSNEITPASATNAHTINFSDDTVENSLSEVAKVYHVAEFGNGSANGGFNAGGAFQDFSMLTTTASHCAYVMDDGLTSLGAKTMKMTTTDAGTGTGGVYMYNATENVSDYYLTFIGTGVSIRSERTGDQPQGTTVVAQNLAYGTHVMRVFRTASHYTDLWIDGVQIISNLQAWVNFWYPAEFVIHQPKKPPIPDDAVVLADYMLMADFVPQTAHTEGVISKGTRRVSATRDFFYDHGHASAARNISVGTYLDYSFVGPYTYLGNQAGLATQQLPFFGTSWTYRYHSTANYMVTGGTTFAINGSDLSSYTLNADGGGGTSVTSAGVLTKIDATDKHNFISAVGGTLGVSVWKQTETTASGKYLYGGDLDVATPIHTSSHYQTFETPFLHELVGGDRNMEQTNLVVTADGKTWDEVTRDVSYLGNTVVCTTTDTSYDVSHSTGIILDEWRGAYNGRAHFNKNFAIAYDRMICLVDGQYSIYAHTVSNEGGYVASIYFNGSAVAQGHGHADNYMPAANMANLSLKRGDYIDIRREWHDAKDTSYVIIERV